MIRCQDLQDLNSQLKVFQIHTMSHTEHVLFGDQSSTTFERKIFIVNYGTVSQQGHPRKLPNVSLPSTDDSKVHSFSTLSVVDFNIVAMIE